MSFRGPTMLKSPKLNIQGGLCYRFAMVKALSHLVPSLQPVGSNLINTLQLQGHQEKKENLTQK